MILLAFQRPFLFFMARMRILKVGKVKEPKGSHSRSKKTAPEVPETSCQ